jgi:hypothetical protein
MAKNTRFSFLTAGPMLGLELPDDFETLPELSAPLTVSDGGVYRSYDFVPAAHDDGMAEHRLLGTMEDRDGRTVELYEQLDPPPQWYLRWILSNGALYTHLREEEGPDRAPLYVESLGIVERDGLPPFLLPESPLGRGVLARPGYQEFALFSSTKGPDWALILQRPGYLANGRVMRDPNNSKAVLRGGACCGIEVTVLSGDDVAAGRQRMSTVRSSLSES